MRKSILYVILLFLVCGVLTTANAQVTGTNGNDYLIFTGTVQPVTTTITNPYTGESILLNDTIYDGLDVFDLLFLLAIMVVYFYGMILIIKQYLILRNLH